MAPHVGWESDFQPMIRSHAPDALAFLYKTLAELEERGKQRVPYLSTQQTTRSVATA